MGTVAAAGRMPSMETEPKTLTLEQLKFAREAAMHVVSTKTREEAILIFTDGLKPVRVAAADSSSSSDDDGGSSSQDQYSKPRGAAVKRDIATAPF